MTVERRSVKNIYLLPQNFHVTVNLKKWHKGFKVPRSRYVITIGKFYRQKVMRVQARRNVYQMAEYYGLLNYHCTYTFVLYVLEILL
jgi:hypothetical protein